MIRTVQTSTPRQNTPQAMQPTPEGIQRRRRLAEAMMQEGTSYAPVQHWTQAAARVAQALVGGMNERAAEQQGQQREAYDAEQASRQKAADRSYSEGALQREVQQKMQLAQQAGLQPGSPQFQQYVYGIKPAEAAGSGMPANVREWQYFSQLPENERQQYLAMKRAQQNLDLGTSYGIPNPMRPGELQGTIQKDLAGAEMQKGYGQDVAKTRAELPEAKLRTEMVTDQLTRLKVGAEAVMKAPGLGQVVGGLYQTYVPNVRGDSLNAQTDLENLKVKISGVVLQSMRDMSKTGGAVGQVTEREWPRLENMIANLDTRQGLPQFQARLREVMAYADQVTEQIKAAYQADLQKAQGMVPQGGTAPSGSVQGDFTVEFE